MDPARGDPPKILLGALLTARCRQSPAIHGTCAADIRDWLPSRQTAPGNGKGPPGMERLDRAIQATDTLDERRRE